MGTYILILLCTGTNALTNIEFSSKNKCEIAREAFLEAANRRVSCKAICVEK